MRTIPLTDITMSVRLYNVLTYLGYKTINEIVERNEISEIKKQKNVGKKTIIELNNIISSYESAKRISDNIAYHNGDTFDFDYAWDCINNQLLKIESLYKEFILNCDYIADLMNHDADFVLMHLLPKTKYDRRDWTRLSLWVESRKEKTFDYLYENYQKHKKNIARNDLIASLGLTKEQLSILMEGEE